MKITNPTLGIKIGDVDFSNCFLIKNDINFSLQEEKMPFIPTSMNNDKIPSRMLETIDLQFTVMPDSKEECIENFKKLKKIINLFKPKYIKFQNQYIPEPENFTGLFNIIFSGLRRPEISVHLTSFSYQFDKDLGFLEVEKKFLAPEEDITKSKITAKMIPISYTISIQGNIILSIFDTIK